MVGIIFFQLGLVERDTALRSIYYMAKVLLALFVGLFRRSVVPAE